MFKLVLFALAAAAALPVAADPPQPDEAPPVAATKISAEAMASDPRMIAAIRHANAVADKRCGGTIGGVVDISARAEAQRCRRRLVATAKLDAEGEIEGH